MGTLQYMTPEEGDVGINWNKDDAHEVGVAREVFHDLVGKGYMAYTVTEEGNGVQLTEFDPNLGRIVVIPQMRGG